MQTNILPLEFTSEQSTLLRREQKALHAALEQSSALTAEHLDRLRATLRTALEQQPKVYQGRLDTLLEDAQVRPHLLHLTLDDAGDDLLNLPWHFATEGSTNLVVSKGLPKRDGSDLPVFAPDLPLPLKILVMVAAPDGSGAARLDYEAEESIILDALTPLMRSGEVEVEFLEDGSLASLDRALAADRYHVLYFSGHSSFGARNIGDTPEATILLEDELSMAARPTPAAEFAAVLAADPSRQPALVILSSCQSGQGGHEGGFKGVAHRLLQAGVPAVVAMGWSVTDVWATRFAGAFFGQLAARKTLGVSFNKALEIARKPFAAGMPETFCQSQSLIPQLFLNQAVQHLVRWEASATKRISRAGEALFQGNSPLNTKLKKVNSILGRADKELRFIGRRRERKAALAALREGRSVLLQGQGGMGKTSLALHLLRQQLAANPDGCVPLAFDHTSLSLDNVNKALLDYLEVDARKRAIRTELAVIEKNWDKFLYLLQAFEAQNVTPFFVFDNLETFQSDETPGGRLDADTLELLEFMLTRLGYPVLCTGRYPLQEFDTAVLHRVNMNEAPFGDFKHKCLHLEYVRQLELPEHSFEAVASTLHRSLGGNYRALEFFDELCSKAPDSTPNTLEALEELIANKAGETLHEMARDLLFERLLAQLQPDAYYALLLLAEFRRPVLPFALTKQDPALTDPEALLIRAADLTLIEYRTGEAAGRTYYFTAPLVRELLQQNNRRTTAFKDTEAGAYYVQMDKDLNKQNLADLEEAFFHYERVDAVAEVNDAGGVLSSYYYEVQQFQRAMHFANRTTAVAGAQTTGRVLNRLGLLFQLSGEYDQALDYLQQSLRIQQEIGDLQGEGTILNNISQIYSDKGDYDQALDYLQQSLRIQQEIGDLQGEGPMLNNISQIYMAKGDYDQALVYLQQSLRIAQEIGDLKGEGTTLNNISQFYSAKGDYDQALVYLQQSLRIRQEIGDRKGEGTTLNNISQIYDAKGDYDQALVYLQQSLRIAQETGDRKIEGATLNNISQIYDAKGDYDQALVYLQQSLRIAQEIGDRQGEGTTMNNIGVIYSAKGKYDQALVYMQQSMEIQQEIGYRKGESATLNNIGQIHHLRGEYDEALRYAEMDLKICQEIGDISDMATTLHNMGTLLFKQQALEAAAPLLLQAYQILKKIGSPNASAPESYLNAIIEQIGEERYRQIIES